MPKTHSPVIPVQRLFLFLILIALLCGTWGTTACGQNIVDDIPNGTAIISDNSVISMVLINAGINETFSELYSHANKFRLMCGTPFMSIYPTKNKNTAAVTPAQNLTKYLKHSAFIFCLFIVCSSFLQWRKSSLLLI